jgi:hypothetical protein
MIAHYVRTAADHLPAWLAFVGAIVVAVVAAATAQWRLHVSNKADKARLDAQLAAEGVRHAERLAHERTLKDLEELRGVLDAAAAQLPVLVDTIGDVALAAAEGGWQATQRPRSQYNKAFLVAVAEKERLAVRLGRQHQVTTLYDGALDLALAASRAVVDTAVSGSVDRDALLGLHLQKMRDFEAASDAFADAAFKAAGSQM